MVGIYKITNPKGKIYIGQSINIEKRWKYYISESYNNRDKQTKLFNSLRKYGPENHVFEIIEECLVEELNEKEIYWGGYYQCTDLNKGLNLRELGKQGVWTKEAKIKLSKSHLGKHKHTDESKRKISESLKGSKRTKEQLIGWGERRKGKININGGSKKGFKKSKESEKRRIEKIIGKKYNTRKSKIDQYDLQGNLLKKWDSVEEIVLKLGLQRNSIYMCCRGELNKSQGYIWKFNNEPRIFQFDLNKNLIKSYLTIKEASDSSKIRRDSISSVLKNKQNTAGGFYWSENKDFGINK